MWVDLTCKQWERGEGCRRGDGGPGPSRWGQRGLRCIADVTTQPIPACRQPCVLPCIPALHPLPSKAETPFSGDPAGGGRFRPGQHAPQQGRQQVGVAMEHVSLIHSLQSVEQCAVIARCLGTCTDCMPCPLAQCPFPQWTNTSLSPPPRDSSRRSARTSAPNGTANRPRSGGLPSSAGGGGGGGAHHRRHGHHAHAPSMSDLSHYGSDGELSGGGGGGGAGLSHGGAYLSASNLAAVAAAAGGGGGGGSGGGSGSGSGADRRPHPQHRPPRPMSRLSLHQASPPGTPDPGGLGAGPGAGGGRPGEAGRAPRTSSGRGFSSDPRESTDGKYGTLGCGLPGGMHCCAAGMSGHVSNGCMRFCSHTGVVPAAWKGWQGCTMHGCCARAIALGNYLGS